MISVAKKKRKKEVGKVIVKKKARRAPSVKIRFDIVFAVIIVALIGVGIFYVVTRPSESVQASKPIEVLYNGLKEVFINKNPNATLDLYYSVRGQIDFSGEVLTIKDFIQYRVFFFNQTIYPNITSEGNETTSAVVLSGFGAIPLGAYYIDPLFNVTGFYSKLKNISELLINVEYLRNERNVSVNVRDLGTDTVYIRTFDTEFQTKVMEYTYTIEYNHVLRHVVAKVWYETNYGVPIKADFNVDDMSVEFELKAADLNYLKGGPT